MNNLFLLLLLTLVGSYAGTFLIMRIAIRRKMIDIPNERSSHSVPTPRGGGIAIVFVWYASITFLYSAGLIERDLFLALVAGVILAAVSLADDIYGLSPSIRLLVQVVTASAGIMILGGVKEPALNSMWAGLTVIVSIIAVIGIVWFVNLFNFLDGIDAYASVEAIAVATGILVITGSPESAVLIMSVAGFLIWNWPKAKIFMGDTGSTQLGYILAILGIYYSNRDMMSLWGWILLTSLFWADATLTLYRRFRNREKLSVAHKKHFYQRLVRSGFSHARVVVLQICALAVLVAMVWLSEERIVTYYITSPVSLLFVILLGRYADMRFGFSKEE